MSMVLSTDTMPTIFKNAFKNKNLRAALWILGAGVACALFVYLISGTRLFTVRYDASAVKDSVKTVLPIARAVPVLDKAAYDSKLLQIANLPVVKPAVPADTAATAVPSTPPKPAPTPLWPVKTAYPLPGAILPFNRIVAYYGNFYSTKMGILGEYEPDVMLQKFRTAIAEWNAADPATPVVPAIEYIAVTAQGSAGFDGKYRARMPFDQIDKAVELAKEINGIVILDIQNGLSDVQTEVPRLEEYLKLPQVHLALDPEFSMKNGNKPGSVIGTMDATDINYVATYLASLVKQYNLPPKILVVHRFTERMVTHSENITPLPEVQVVMDADGWGSPVLKSSIYRAVVSSEPVQFTGIKLFYKNDLRAPSTALLTPAQILKFTPQPSFIQYQ